MSAPTDVPTVAASVEELDRARLMQQMHDQDWPLPRSVQWLPGSDGIASPRPVLLVTARTAADVHVIAGKLGTIATTSWHVGPRAGVTDPAGPWFASRHTWYRREDWGGLGTDLQVSHLESAYPEAVES